MRTNLSLLSLSFALYTVLGSTVHQPSRSFRMAIPLPPQCNINVCFAIDGSVPLKSWQFQLQKNFVSRVVRTVQTLDSVNVAGVQYGLDNLVISSITNDKRLFVTRLSNATFSAADTTFISGGITYCHRQVRSVPEQSNKIVVLGSGIADFGGDPVITADQFRQDGGEMFTIEVGSETDRGALNAIAGGQENVFTLTRGIDIFPAVRKFLPKLCGTETGNNS